MGERAALVRQMIFAGTDEEEQAAYDTLLPLQREDFIGIFEAMDGLPVTVRLLDPPLHEFLPDRVELSREVAVAEFARERAQQFLQAQLEAEQEVAPRNPVEGLVEQMTEVVRPVVERTPLRPVVASPSKVQLDDVMDDSELEEKRLLLQKVNELHEANPMLGLRGVRLGIIKPGLYAMQVRAIVEAAVELKKKGKDPRPEIMIPLVATEEELHQMRDELEPVAKEILERDQVELHIEFGTMIELPTACISADEIAHHADFFSFGTNDLTQTAFGFSRDDIGKFLAMYEERKLVPYNPFVTIHPAVGRLMEIAVEGGRSSNPDMHLGICGEHGGDPDSVWICERLGLDYVSCSPFRVPTARWAAAQAVMGEAQTSSK